MKPLEQKKHREFWIDSWPHSKGYYCAFKHNTHMDNDIHVIEHSALLEMEKRAEELVKALAFLKSELQAINNYDEQRYKHMTAWQEANKAIENWRKRCLKLESE